MNYVKRNFIFSDIHDMSAMRTSFGERETYANCEVTFSNPETMYPEFTIDLSFDDESSKEASLKSINLIINDLNELKMRMLNHKFKEVESKQEEKSDNL